MKAPGVGLSLSVLTVLGAFSGVIRAGAVELGEAGGVYPDDGRDFWQNAGYYTAQHAIGIYEGIAAALSEKGDKYMNGSYLHLSPDESGLLKLIAIEKDGVIESVGSTAMAGKETMIIATDDFLGAFCKLQKPETPHLVV